MVEKQKRDYPGFDFSKRKLCVDLDTKFAMRNQIIQFFTNNDINYIDACGIALMVFSQMEKELAQRSAISYEEKQEFLQHARSWLKSAEVYNMDLVKYLIKKFNEDALKQPLK